MGCRERPDAHKGGGKVSLGIDLGAEKTRQKEGDEREKKHDKGLRTVLVTVNDSDFAAVGVRVLDRGAEPVEDGVMVTDVVSVGLGLGGM